MNILAERCHQQLLISFTPNPEANSSGKKCAYSCFVMACYLLVGFMKL